MPAYTVHGSNANRGGTKLSAPMVVPSGITLSGMITLFAPTPVQLPRVTSPVMRDSFTSSKSGGGMKMRLRTKSSLAHQTFTPAERLE